MIRALEMPEDHAARVAWLERELVGPELSKLASELAAVARGEQDDSSAVAAAELAADSRLIANGLSWLDDRQLATLLLNPVSLVGIQRRVLSADSAYWSRVAPPADGRFSKAIDRTRDAVLAAATSSEPVSVRPTEKSGGWRRSAAWSLAAALATAAAVMLTVDRWRPVDADAVAKTTEATDLEPSIEPDTPPVVIASDQAWGFGKFARDIADSEDALASPLDRRAYLNQLADAAEAWGAKPPEDREQLVRRLGEFRLGCSAVLMATHGPLPEADREWLRTRCRSWASAIDRHLAQAESATPVDDVMTRVDATVVKIAESLRGRAETTPKAVS